MELDFLAPFLVKHGGVEAMTRKVALQVKKKSKHDFFKPNSF